MLVGWCGIFLGECRKLRVLLPHCVPQGMAGREVRGCCAGSGMS